MDGLALVFAVAATFNWGLGLLLMKVGVDRMNWVGFGLLRPWMSLPFVLLIAWIFDAFTFGSPRLVLIGLAGGVLNTLFGTALYYHALSQVSMHEANILANTNPFWGVVCSILFLGEPARLVTFGAGALVLGGTCFLVRGSRDETRKTKPLALLAALAAGAIWGFSGTVPAKICLDGGMNPFAYQVLFVASSAIGWTLFASPRLLTGRLRFGRKDLLVAFGSAFFGLALSWLLWLLALERASGSALSPMLSLTLVFSVILGAIFLRQPITRRMVIGGALVVAGVLLVSVFAT